MGSRKVCSSPPACRALMAALAVVEVLEEGPWGMNSLVGLLHLRPVSSMPRCLKVLVQAALCLWICSLRLLLHPHRHPRRKSLFRSRCLRNNSRACRLRVRTVRCLRLNNNQEA